MRNLLCYIIFILADSNYAHSLFVPQGKNNNRSKIVKNKCDGSNNSALVEHFFSIIFSEFHNTPPGCVCVQMCPDQPTYCYPNGCLKKPEVSKKPEVALPVTRISESTKPIFFLEDKTDFMNDFLDKNYVDENASVMPAPQTQESSAPINLRPDPFKGRYKILFKYKKLPKVELKYNLGEQVKNIKSDMMKKDNMDVSKTRWPLNKVNPNFNGQRARSDKQDTSSKFFMSMFLDKDVENYPSKYFKRELANNTYDDDDTLDIKAIYVLGDSVLENNTYSFENLIDDLIRSSFYSNKSSNLGTKSDIGMLNEINNDNVETINSGNVTIKPDSTESNPYNETTRIVSMNFTNETVDRNKYTKTADSMNFTNKTLDRKKYKETAESMNFTNKTVDSNKYIQTAENNRTEITEMIASLSKKIDMENNTSLEMMKRITNVTDFVSPTTETMQIIVNTSKETTSSTVTTENIVTSVEYDSRTTKKNRQILSRRLQNSKNN